MGDFATIGRGNDGIDLQNYNKAHRCALNSVTVVSKDDDRYDVRFRCMTPQECITPKNFEDARMRMIPDVICDVMALHYWQVTDPHHIFCNTYKQKNKIRGSG